MKNLGQLLFAKKIAAMKSKSGQKITAPKSLIICDVQWSKFMYYMLSFDKCVAA